MPAFDTFMKAAVMREDLAISEATSQEKISDEAIREELSRIADSLMFIQSMTVADQDGRGRRFEQIIGKSPALRAVLEQVERVAPADSTVLVQGETGTGKELIAHAIHNASLRSGHTLIKLNCAAIPFDLLESELFGQRSVLSPERISNAPVSSNERSSAQRHQSRA